MACLSHDDRSLAMVCDEMNVQSEMLALAVIKSINNGEIITEHVFGDAPVGASRSKLICNSIPKSGTYLLVELAKHMGFADIGFHLNTDFVERRTTDEKSEQPRPMPSILQVAGLKSGQCAPGHLHYSFALENFLMSRSEYRMLFIIRDPRDLVISWVDFVYSSSAYRSTAWNEYCQKQANISYPTDEARISSSIDGLLGMGLDRFMPWINSPACLTVKFEDLYPEISSGKAGPTVDRIASYLDCSSIDVGGVLGAGRTASNRPDKVGVYKRRMTKTHLERIEQTDFQKLVIQFGYPPT
jgi:hypothetical protein